MSSNRLPDPDRALDDALAAGYGADPASVVDALSRARGDLTHVLLRESSPERDLPPVLTRIGDAASRPMCKYRLLGEIARGGMGVILKGNDVDLGRDVALKVLHRELAGNRDALQRFIEEAQIGGQLQHPGIVPVYELGLMADQRPYFAMKLINGRTFSAVLDEQRSSSGALRAHLGIFEAVCQTLAYAHSRGVIHRDLKPSNVMVGAFGEVQVVDWGLAKVVRSGGVDDERRATVDERTAPETVRSGAGQAQSEFGSVFGTPAYMPPEQARGEVERLDSRSDVFALGAILCEVLTAAPPHPGDRERALRAAARADLVDAQRRLDACECDRELIELCKRCLAPEPRSRPSDAGVLVERLHAYTSSLDERARLAQIEAAEARVKAAEERRARKLTVALTTSISLALLAIGGGWAWLTAKRSARQGEISVGVNAALAEAAVARERQDWSSAGAAVERARALSDAPETDEALRERVRTTRDAVHAEIAADQAARELERRNHALLERLELVRRLEGGLAVVAGEQGVRLAPAPPKLAALSLNQRKDQNYADAFATLDIDVDRAAENDSIEVLRKTGIAMDLALALDEWARARDRADHEHPEPAQRLTRIALGVDDDPTRRAVRNALLAGDTAALMALSDAARDGDVDVATALTLSDALQRASKADQALELLRAVQRHHRDDFTLNHRLGEVLLRKNTNAAFALAKPYSMAAVALQPTSTSALCNLGVAETFTSEAEAAVITLRRAVELEPSFSSPHINLCVALTKLHRFDEAEAEGRRGIELDPFNAIAYHALGATLLEKQDLDGASTIYRRAIELDPKDARLLDRFAGARLKSGELDQAVEALKRATEADPDLSESWNHYGYVHLLRNENEEAAAAFRRAADLDPDSASAFYNLGLALINRDDIEGALTALKRAAKLDPRDPGTQHNLGVAYSKRRDFDSAIACFRRASQLDPTSPLPQIELGYSLRDNGELDLAIPAFRRAIALGYAETKFVNYVAWLLVTTEREDLRDPKEAIALATHLLETTSTDARIWNTLGVARYRAGDFEGCIDALLKPDQLDSGVIVSGYLFLAMAYQRLGHGDDAQSWYQRWQDWASNQAEIEPEMQRFAVEARAVLDPQAPTGSH